MQCGLFYLPNDEQYEIGVSVLCRADQIKNVFIYMDVICMPFVLTARLGNVPLRIICWKYIKGLMIFIET